MYSFYGDSTLSFRSSRVFRGGGRCAGRNQSRPAGFNFNYSAVDTAAIKSIAVFGCDIDHTGVGKITKLFPRHCARVCTRRAAV